MYYFWANEAQAGPYTLNQVRAMWNSGQINGTTIYWQEGMAGWTPLSAIAHIIEDPAPVREAPRILEPKPSQPQPSLPAIPVALLFRWLQIAVFGLALIAFFLPNVSVTLPILGNMSMSMLDLVTTKPNDSTRQNSFPTARASRDPQPPNFWDDIADNKESAGGIICAVSIFLLMGHYLLTIVWGTFTFVLKQSYDAFTFVWLALAIQFPILLLIGGQILLGGMKSKIAADTANNAFAGFGEAFVGSISIQPGVVTWFLMVLALGASILLFYQRKR